MNSTNEQQSDPKSNVEIISMGDDASNGIEIIDNDEWIEISIASSGDTTEDLPISPSKHLSNNFAIEGDKPELIPPNSKNPFSDIKLFISTADCSSVDSNINLSGHDDLRSHSNSLGSNIISPNQEGGENHELENRSAYPILQSSLRSCNRGGQQNKLKQRLEAKRAQRHGHRMNRKKRNTTPEQQRDPNNMNNAQIREHFEGGIARKKSSLRQKKELSLQLFEVELVLRKKLSSHDDIICSLDEARKCMIFLQQLEDCASKCNCTVGGLFRFILPHDANTHLRREDSIRDLSTSSTQTSLTTSSLDTAALIPTEIKDLIAGALLLRNLVRIKIADDGDLLTASTALKSTISFLGVIMEAGKSDVLAILRDM